MAVTKTRNCKDDFKKSILGTAKILTEKADEIVADVDTLRVCRVSITLTLYPHEAPDLKVSKYYYPIRD